MAIDNKALLEKVLQGLGTLGQTEVPPVYPNYFGIDEKKVIPFDIDGANKLLDEAGYVVGPPDGIRLDKQGQPLNLRLMGRSSNPQHAQISEYLVSWLKEIGIGLNVAMYSDNQVNDDSTLGKYDLYFTGWGIGPDPRLPALDQPLLVLPPTPTARATSPRTTGATRSSTRCSTSSTASSTPPSARSTSRTPSPRSTTPR